MLGLAGLVAVDGPLWAIVALAVLATCFSCFFGPTIGAYLPTLVRDERELGPANSAWSTLDNLAFVIGPAVAAILIQLSGLTLAFVLNAISFAFVSVILWRLPHERRTGGEPASAGEDADAERKVGAIPRTAIAPLAGLALIDIVAGFVFGGLGVLTVIIVVKQLGLDEAATGFLNAAVGVGGILGAVASGAFVIRSGLRVPLLVGSIALAAGVAAARSHGIARARPGGDGDRLGRQPADRGRQHHDLPADRARRGPRPGARRDRDDLDPGLRRRIARAARRLGRGRDGAGAARLGRTRRRSAPSSRSRSSGPGPTVGRPPNSCRPRRASPGCRSSPGYPSHGSSPRSPGRPSSASPPAPSSSTRGIPPIASS